MVSTWAALLRRQHLCAVRADALGIYACCVLTSIAATVNVEQGKMRWHTVPIVNAKGAPFKLETVDKGRLASRNNSNRVPAGHAETSKHSTKQRLDL